MFEHLRRIFYVQPKPAVKRPRQPMMSMCDVDTCYYVLEDDI
jgi:hypothetical protein